MCLQIQARREQGVERVSYPGPSGVDSNFGPPAEKNHPGPLLRPSFLLPSLHPSSSFIVTRSCSFRFFFFPLMLPSFSSSFFNTARRLGGAL